MGVLDRRDYELCVQVLETTAAANVKAERLKKVAAMTLDQELQRLLEPIIALYADYPGPSGSHKDWLAVLKAPKAELQRYIAHMIKENRPQWQVIAEQNGWCKRNDAGQDITHLPEVLALRQEVAVLKRRIETIRQETAAPLQAKIEALQAVIVEQDELLEKLHMREIKTPPF